MLARVKVGDLVEVISGKDKKKRGVITAVSTDGQKIKVKGIALATKFVKKQDPLNKSGENSSGIVKQERFIHSCKVMPICPGDDKPCRVKVGKAPSGEKIRVSVRSGLKI